MLPAVVVEIAPADSAPRLKEALLDACSRATQEARCVEGGTPVEDEGAPVVVAIVSWRDARSVRLEVALRKERQWLTRDVSFEERDAPEERWRTVGLVIGALASVMARGTAEATPAPPGAPAPAPAPAAPETAEPSPSTPVPATPPPSPPEPPQIAAAPPPAPPPAKAAAPAPAPRRVGAARVPSREVAPPPRGFATAGGAVGTGLTRGPLRVGGALRAHVRLVAPSTYAALGFAHAEGATRQDGVLATFSEATLGLAFARSLGPTITVAGRAEALVQRLATSVAADAPGPSSGNRWLGGAELGVDAIGWVLPPVGVFVGASGRWVAGVTEVRRAGALVGTAKALGVDGHVGLAVAF